MTDTAQAEDNGPDRPAPSGSRRDERRTVRLANRIGAFAQAHGGTAQGQISYLGQRGVRLVLVAEDGTWGDQVAPSRAMAEQAAERAGITLHDTLDGELAGRMRTGPYEWSRMAGIQLGGGTAGS